MEQPRCEVEKPQKHLNIDSSIINLINIKDKLQRLSYRINGEDEPPSSTSTDIPEPCLLDILNRSDSRINEISDQINGIINEIQEALF